MELIDEDQSAAIAALETRLVEFYNTFKGYQAFTDPPEYPVLWGRVWQLAEQISLRPDKPRARVLEIGAGRPGFGPFLTERGARERVHLTSQDITTANLAHLQLHADDVRTENIDRLEGQWDLIFHSYVYEHLCRPREFNERLWSLLAPGGALLVQSPRYDFPLYFPPCWDHLTGAAKALLAVRLAASDLAAAGGGDGRGFTIFADPAVFHLPFIRDRDAVHRVRKNDLLRLFRGRARVEEFRLPAGDWKDWIVKNFLTLRLILHKAG